MSFKLLSFHERPLRWGKGETDHLRFVWGGPQQQGEQWLPVARNGVGISRTCYPLPSTFSFNLTHPKTLRMAHHISELKRKGQKEAGNEQL